MPLNETRSMAAVHSVMKKSSETCGGEGGGEGEAWGEGEREGEG